MPFEREEVKIQKVLGNRKGASMSCEEGWQAVVSEGGLTDPTRHSLPAC